MIEELRDTLRTAVAALQYRMEFNPGAIILAVIAATPGVLAYFTRKTSVTERASNTATRTRVDEFNALFQEQRQQITDCREECGTLRSEKYVLEKRVDELEDHVQKLERDLSEERRRREFLEQIIRMRGGDPEKGVLP